MSPLISIIVPVYNTAPYLRRCLDSLCNQSYSNLEIICINDGSIELAEGASLLVYDYKDYPMDSFEILLD